MYSFVWRPSLVTSSRMKKKKKATLHRIFGVKTLMRLSPGEGKAHSMGRKERRENWDRPSGGVIERAETRSLSLKPLKRVSGSVD